MKDQALRVIKTMAKKLSIVNTDGEIKFKFEGELIQGGVGVNNPSVMIEEKELDEYLGDKELYCDEEVAATIKSTVKIIN